MSQSLGQPKFPDLRQRIPGLRDESAGVRLAVNATRNERQKGGERRELLSDEAVRLVQLWNDMI